jgi:excisionase family DNA binding protein
MKLLTIQDAAQVLSISPWTVRSFIRQGKLRPIRVGRLVRLEDRELEQFVRGLKDPGAEFSNAGQEDSNGN